MRQNAKNNNTERIITQMIIEKKKVVMALCLVAIMVLMWARVILKKAPKAAAAAQKTDQNDVEKDSGSDVDVTYIKLPQIEGRNDAITRDFFASNGWGDFFKKDGESSNDNIEVDGVSASDIEEIKRIVKDKLKLEAIGLGGNSRALINDKMLSKGEKISIRDRNREYECEVIEIRADSVVISCQETEVVLNLTKMTGNSQ